MGCMRRCRRHQGSRAAAAAVGPYSYVTAYAVFLWGSLILPLTSQLLGCRGIFQLELTAVQLCGSGLNCRGTISTGSEDYSCLCSCSCVGSGEVEGLDTGFPLDTAAQGVRRTNDQLKSPASFASC